MGGSNGAQAAAEDTSPPSHCCCNCCNERGLPLIQRSVSFPGQAGTINHAQPGMLRNGEPAGQRFGLLFTGDTKNSFCDHKHLQSLCSKLLHDNEVCCLEKYACRGLKLVSFSRGCQWKCIYMRVCQAVSSASKSSSVEPCEELRPGRGPECYYFVCFSLTRSHKAHYKFKAVCFSASSTRSF